MILVVGASGLTGLEICRQLAKAGKPVRALVRSTTDPGKQQELKRLGVSLALGDLKEPSSLKDALGGISTVISTASSTFSRRSGDSIEAVDFQGQLSLVRSAKAAGVAHFIFLSFPPLAEDFELQRAKRAVENALVEGGLAYTTLQPSYFTEVWLSPAVGFDFANATAQIYGPGNNAISWISYADVARYAVAAVDNPAARNAVVELGGPDALTPLQVVRIFEEVGGQKFALSHVPEEALRAQKAAAGDSLAEAFAVLMLTYAKGLAIDTKPAQRIFANQVQQLAAVRDYARRLHGTASA